MVYVLPSNVAVVKPRVLLRRVGSNMCAERASVYRRRVRRSVPAVRYLVKDGEWATEIMPPPIKPFIRGRALGGGKGPPGGKGIGGPVAPTGKGNIMVGDRYEGGGRETFRPAGAGATYIQTINLDKGSWSC